MRLLLGGDVRLLLVGFVAYVVAEASVAFWMSGFVRGLVVFLAGQGGAVAVLRFWGVLSVVCLVGLVLLPVLVCQLLLAVFWFLGFGLFAVSLVVGVAVSVVALRFGGFFLSVLFLVLFWLWLLSVRLLDGVFSGLLWRGMLGGVVVLLLVFVVSVQWGLGAVVLLVLVPLLSILGVGALCLGVVVAQTLSLAGDMLGSGLFATVFVARAGGAGWPSLGAALMVQRRGGVRRRGLVGAVSWVLLVCAGASVVGRLGAWSQFLAVAAGAAVAGDAGALLAAVRVLGWVLGWSLFGPRVLVTGVILAALRRAGLRGVLGLLVRMRDLLLAFGPALVVEVGVGCFGVPAFAALFALVVFVLVVGLYSRGLLGAVALVFGVARVEVVWGAEGPLFWRVFAGFRLRIVVAVVLFASFFGSVELVVGWFEVGVVCLLPTVVVAVVFGVLVLATKVGGAGWIVVPQVFTDVGLPERGLVADGVAVVDPFGLVRVGWDGYSCKRVAWALFVVVRFVFPAPIEWLVGYAGLALEGVVPVVVEVWGEGCVVLLAWAGGHWCVTVSVPVRTVLSVAAVRCRVCWVVRGRERLVSGVGLARRAGSAVSGDGGGCPALGSRVRVGFAVPPAGAWGVLPVLAGPWVAVGCESRSVVPGLAFPGPGVVVRLVSGVFCVRAGPALDFVGVLLVPGRFGSPLLHLSARGHVLVDGRGLFPVGAWRFGRLWPGPFVVGSRGDGPADLVGRVSGGWGADCAAFWAGLYRPVPPGQRGFGRGQGGGVAEGVGGFGGLDASAVLGGGGEPVESASFRAVAFRLGVRLAVLAVAFLFGSLSAGCAVGGFGAADVQCVGSVCLAGGAGPASAFFGWRLGRVGRFALGLRGVVVEPCVFLLVGAF
ncbi:hypothetical protein SAMN04487939_103249 [Lysobacter sp. yr284]|uniref:hypothetical protein n=1 Tax=Lysobacter sp. yr284 TaxID=1761791 RepID=UPI00089A7556|nr:hypothetical protein [Lysobacter sp. yr284]SDY57158.1 hypothetical protein SAMN04487939_103249 [Lysobacter sp. yr284]